MARYRKCPRSCAQGLSCMWKDKMLQQMPRLKCPYFLKNMSQLMLSCEANPPPRLEIPSQFVQEHGDKFQEVIEVHGPCNQKWVMELRIQKAAYNRVAFDRGWPSFVSAHVLNKGDHLIFALTGFSKFTVYIFDDLGNRKPSPSVTRGNGCKAGNNSVHTGDDPQERGAAQNMPQPPAELHQNSCKIPEPSSAQPMESPHIFTESDTSGDKRRPGENGAGSPNATDVRNPEGNLQGDPQPLGSDPIEICLPKPAVIELSDDQSREHDGSEKRGSRDNDAGKESEIVSEEANNLQQWMEGDQNLPSRCPQFTKRLAAVSLKHEGYASCTHLEIPAEFVQKHEGLFTELIRLQGPNGRIWPVVCHISAPQRYTRVKLKAGWADFAEDNKFKLGDQLLFTHVAEDRFVVKVIAAASEEDKVPSARQDNSKGIPGNHEHEDDALRLHKDKAVGPDKPTSPIQQPSKTKKLTPGLPVRLPHHLSDRRFANKQTEGHWMSRKRGRMEWGLAHS